MNTKFVRLPNGIGALVHGQLDLAHDYILTYSLVANADNYRLSCSVECRLLRNKQHIAGEWVERSMDEKLINLKPSHYL